MLILMMLMTGLCIMVPLYCTVLCSLPILYNAMPISISSQTSIRLTIILFRTTVLIQCTVQNKIHPLTHPSKDHRQLDSISDDTLGSQLFFLFFVSRHVNDYTTSYMYAHVLAHKSLSKIQVLFGIILVIHNLVYS